MAVDSAALKNLLVEEAGGILRITLNRPEKRNALSVELMTELTQVIDDVGADHSNRVVILAAEGPAFSAGHDLREMLERDIQEYRRTFDVCVQLMRAIQRIAQPVIAEVSGIATAAGCQLVATCDLAVAADTAKFATPGVKIGLFCTTPMVALTRAIGRKRAMQMLLTGDFIDATTAQDWGLINAAVPAGQLRGATQTLAEKIVQAASSVVELGKAAFYAQIDLDQAAAYTYAKEVMSTNAATEDAQEGMSAFVNKRQPKWTR
ncbi:MAG: enoyl-CoA hydratase [Candidatus Eremiobacteraeota bacterium]|nr:enoyl-CoA hydratase [Candidatus Eremiobacteraeota bacterium]